MNKLSNYLVEQILLEDTDTKIKKTVVVYSGRFQPFHNGHYKTYQLLVKKFGKSNVYIGTSNKVDLPKSPFNFKEKAQIMSIMFGIPKSNIVQIKNPYKPTEILSKFDEETTAYVTVVGEKDANRLGGKYFTKLGNDEPTESYRDKGYVFSSPSKFNTLSGTDVRNGLSIGSEDEKKNYFEKTAYSKYNPKIYNLITNKLHETITISKEVIEEWLLKENTTNATGQSDDGPAAFFPNLKVFSKISVSRAKQIGYDVLDMIMTKEIEDYYEHPNYPDGPVKAVSYYPAGVIGAMTPNNQIDIYSSDAYSAWYKHVTRKASLVGYELIQTQLERDVMKQIKNLSGDMAKANKEIEAEFELMMNESITLPIEIGDTLLMGKWKNKKVVVKTIGKDEHGMPTINGKKVVTFRFGKKGPNIFENEVVTEDLTTGFKNLGISRKNMPQIESEDLKKYIKYIKSKGYSYKLVKYPVEKLNLTQKEINKDKIEKLMTTKVSNLAKPVVISKGGYILDGHHRILALYALNKNAKIPAVQIDLDILELLKLSRNWGDVTFKNVNELITLTEATNKLKINIPKGVMKIQKAFKKHGKKVYIVGGAVRDAILGKTPHDFDLSTDAKAHEMISICDKEGLKHIDTDIIYGTIIINGDEVTQFRKDVGTTRKLDGIDYTDIEGDVKRRDLTINALFYDIERKEIVDLVGGIKDLQDKKIRTVGKASDRFEEDHLRKLRAVRFTVKLGGTMDSETLLAIQQDPTLKQVSANRIRMEFMKSVESAKSTKIYLNMMEKLTFLKLTFPGLKITKPYIEESNYIVLMAQLLKKNSKKSLESTLNSINYTSKEIINVTFLQSLDSFKPQDIVEYKKQQKRTSLTDDQIISYGKHNKKDYKKFVKFTTKISGKDAPKDVKGKEIGNWIEKEETKRFINEGTEPQIRTFKELFSKLPSDLQKRVYGLKNIDQNKIHHPEGNVLKHTITVVNRAFKFAPGDMSLALAGLFHDIGKDETGDIHPTKGHVTHYDHEKVSASLIKQYRSTIIKLGGKPSDVFFIVKNHMRMKNFDVMKISKKRKLQGFGAFDKLSKFTDKMDKGGLQMEMAKSELDSVERFADKTLNPVDVDFTKHFFDRVNDPRNKKEITAAELIGFFKRLSKDKRKFSEFLKKYKDIVVKDDKTKINIPFVKHANRIIAKTVMRKTNFKTHEPSYHFENITDLVNDIDSKLESFILPNIQLNEGGAYGHMSHPFDTDINLTFGQLKDIVNKALDGKLEFTREKTDGQALAVSWKDGKLVAARNKGHLKNRGENALDIKGISDKFQGRGGLTDAYNFAMRDLSKAIGKLSKDQQDKIFAQGSKFMNIEVIFPTSVNVIPYGQALLVFHGTMEYSLDGVAIGESTDSGRILSGMIKQINQHVQDAYTIQGPPIIKLPKNQDLSNKKSGYLSKITKLQKEFGLKNSDGVAMYHQSWWDNYITKTSPTKLDDATKKGLIKRWAFSNKSFRLDKKNLPDEKLLSWAKKLESENQKKISKDNLMKFENIFLGIGADVLEFTTSVLTVNPDDAVRKMKDKMEQTIKDVRKSGDPKKIEKLELELKRLNAIGGIDKIVPSEGIVFVYNGHTMKMTGAFASLNQLLGIFF